MIFFGHLGITLATIRVTEIASKKIKPGTIKRNIDYRIVLLGSILPDLIDKPIILLSSNGIYSSGRIYGHSLIFFIILFIAGIFIK